jgi:hypothetical protein
MPFGRNTRKVAGAAALSVESHTWPTNSAGAVTRGGFNPGVTLHPTDTPQGDDIARRLIPIGRLMVRQPAQSRGESVIGCRSLLPDYSQSINPPQSGIPNSRPAISVPLQRVPQFAQSRQTLVKPSFWSDCTNRLKSPALIRG